MNEKNDINNSTILITGVAGFIGGALALKLITTTSAQIIGIDSMNDYYDVRLKENRLNRIKKEDVDKRFLFIKADIADKDKMLEIFAEFRPNIVIHLAAQAGVRYSIENPDVYVRSNIIGFYNMVEACRYSREKLNHPVDHFLFASSSSVYGNNERIPYSEDDNTDYPVSLYAATKKADEVIGYSYAKLYGIPMTGMRFFTVYGPTGRPDMAYFKFTDKLEKGEKIEVYNKGKNKRDFTYIDDVVYAIEKILSAELKQDINGTTYNIYNIGNNHPIETIEFVKTLVEALKEFAVLDEGFEVENKIILREAMLGDVEATYAGIDKLEKNFGTNPTVALDDGLARFAKWYAEYRETCDFTRG